MALKIELDARAKKMERILAEVNAALAAKNAAAAESFNDIASAVSGIEEPTVSLQDISINENGVYTADSGYDGFGTVTVNVAGGEIEAGIVFNEITEEGKVVRAKLYGSEIPSYAFAGQDELIEADIPESLDIIRSNSFFSCKTLPGLALNDNITTLETNSFYDCRALALTSLPASLTSIGTAAFYRNMAATFKEIPAGVTEIKGNAFNYCTGLTEMTFKGTPGSIASTAFNNCSNLAVINVPWAEGAVANAPWGASKATINYNYTGE